MSKAEGTQRAKTYLTLQGISPQEINPAQFAMAADQLDMDFDALLRYLEELMAGGQGLGPVPYTRKIA